jgi:ABC-type spermidine/putrescine transport system permease subunit II
LRRGRGLGLAAFTLCVFAFLYAPLGLVFINAFNRDELLVRWGGFTVEWFRGAITSERVQDDFRTSAVVAALATVISLVIAVSAGLWWRGASYRKRQLLDATTYMRIVLPEVVAALGLFVLFRRLDFELGIATIVAGHVVFTSAYATVIVQARLATLDRTLDEAAADLGAPPFRVFRRVTLPLLWPALIVAALLSFSFSFDDVVTSTFLGGTGAETLPMYLLGLARFRITPEVNAIGAGVMLITMLLVGLAVLLVVLRWGEGGRVLGLGSRGRP